MHKNNKIRKNSKKNSKRIQKEFKNEFRTEFRTEFITEFITNSKPNSKRIQKRIQNRIHNEFKIEFKKEFRNFVFLMEVLHINQFQVQYKRGYPVGKDVVRKMFPKASEDLKRKLEATCFYEQMFDLETFINKAAKIAGVPAKELWKTVSYHAQRPKKRERPSSSDEEEKGSNDNSNNAVPVVEPPPVPVASPMLNSLGMAAASPPRDQFFRFTKLLEVINATIQNLDKDADGALRKNLLNLQLKYVKLLDDMTPSEAQYSVSERAQKLGLELDHNEVASVGKRARELFAQTYDGKSPSQRIVDVGTKHVPINVYSESEAKQSLDIAIIEKINGGF